MVEWGNDRNENIVVDDEVFICEFLDEYLSMYGYQVITAGNAGGSKFLYTKTRRVR